MNHKPQKVKLIFLDLVWMQNWVSFTSNFETSETQNPEQTGSEKVFFFFLKEKQTTSSESLKSAKKHVLTVTLFLN